VRELLSPRFDNPASPSTFHGFKDFISLQAAADLYAPTDDFTIFLSWTIVHVLSVPGFLIK